MEIRLTSYTQFDSVTHDKLWGHPTQKIPLLSFDRYAGDLKTYLFSTDLQRRHPGDCQSSRECSQAV